MYKIAYWLNSLGVGGTEKTAVLFSKYLDKNKFSVEFFTYADADLTRRKEIIDLGFNIRYINRKNPDWSLLRTFNIVHSFRSGIEESPTPGLNFHGPKFVETNVFGQLSSNRFIDKSLFMSEWLMNDTLTKYHISNDHPLRGRFDFINNPVEISLTEEKFDVTLRYSRGAVILGRSGRPEDGVYDSINVMAAKKLQDKGYNLAFMCLGCPPSMKRDLDSLGLKYHVVEPTVDSITISKFYNSIDLLAWARPDGESGGSAIQEAMMHGKPVLTYKAEPLYAGMGVWQNQVGLAKNCGFSVNRNVDEYAEKLELLISSEDLRPQLGRQAKERALKEFEAGLCAKKLEKIYDSLNA